MMVNVDLHILKYHNCYRLCQQGVHPCPVQYLLWWYWGPALTLSFCNKDFYQLIGLDDEVSKKYYGYNFYESVHELSWMQVVLYWGVEEGP